MSSFSLRNSAIVPATYRRYSHAARTFLSFLTQQHITIYTSSQLDMVLASYIEYLYHNQYSLSFASYVFHGLLFFCPQYKDHVLIAQSQLAGWKRRCPSVPKPPLTPELVLLVSAVMLRSGYTDCAVATVVAFDCYLRISEFTRLSVRDVHSFRDRTALRLASTKTGTNQSVIVRDLHTLSVLLAYKAHRITVVGVVGSLFGLSADRYRHVFHRVCSVLQLSSVHFTPHSLRHGAATRDYLEGVLSIDDILFRGRWANTKSARIYVQSSRALLIQMDIPSYAAQLAHTLRGVTLTDMFAPYIASMSTHSHGYR